MTTMTRDQAALIRAINYGHVRRTSGGLVVWRRHGAPSLRVGRRVHELVDERLAALGPDGGTYQLTDTGRAALAATERPAA